MKLKARAEEQKKMKDEIKRQMREDIEKAERAKKEMIKEQMLEEERQREIARIREEVILWNIKWHFVESPSIIPIIRCLLEPGFQ